MKTPVLLGALWGDICGAPYEFSPERNAARINLAHPARAFTDDSVLTLAVAKAILEHRPYGETICELAHAYPRLGWGSTFRRVWLEENRAEPYGSFGNGAAMRVAPVGWAFNTVEDVLREAAASAACSHDHPLGILSAQAAALAVFLARKGQDKEAIRAAVETHTGWALTNSLKAVRAEAAVQGFDETWRAVPLALSAFLATASFEDCLRQTIALGGDADTQACIACAVAEAYYGVDEELAAQVLGFLDARLRNILLAFGAKFGR